MKIKRMITAGILSSTLLVGCGTVNEGTNGSGSAPESEELEESVDQKQPSDTDVNDSEDVNKEEENDMVIRLFEQLLSFEKDGQQVEETGFLKTSTNQNFSLYVLEDWTLDSEEPGSDVLLKGDDFVRIRLLDKADKDADFSAYVEEQAKAVSSEYFHNETIGLEGIVDSSVWYKSYTEDVSVSNIWIRGDVPMLVTIHIEREETDLPAILAMLNTIAYAE
ncbi:hypothetical protein GCM10008967_13310 [Bacillus carboniphilus]|uniref:Lipoprotein n=1 Tax=Bacillus carboniphilus TaxID=86663 RepID=A0ABP3FRU8_9BACI